MLAQFFAYVRTPVLETIGIASGALVIAVLLGAPLSIVIARGGRLGALVKSLAVVVRAIPDLVLAIILVVAVGLGPLAGTLALGLHYAAVIAKLYAEILEATPTLPREALRASGAGAAVAFLVGTIPLAWKQLVAFGAYSFESIIRASVIVGVVGAGGLGSAIVQALNLANYREFFIYVLAIVLLVLAVDALSVVFRTRLPAFASLGALVALAVIGVVSFILADVDVAHFFRIGAGKVIVFLASAFPPAFSAKIASTLVVGIAQTLEVALTGTILGAMLALPLAWFAARPIAFGWMRGTGLGPWALAPNLIARIILSLTRSIPVVAAGLIALTLVGLGPKAGALALVVHTAGVLGKLFAESFEAAGLAPAEALVATGSGAAAAAAVGLLPGAFETMMAHLLYRWEWNLRASTILGMVGAGGLGQAIFNAQQLLFYHELLTYVTAAITLVLLSDAASWAVRRRLRLQTMER